MNYLFLKWIATTFIFLLLDRFVIYFLPFSGITFIEACFMAYVIIWCEVNERRKL